jgi:4-amino-4-deoxy-L-arabinose transferase-like glycosyltransferase
MVDTSSRERPRAVRLGAGLEQWASARSALPAVIALGVAVRLGADLLVGADVPQYEFGIIAENLTSGRGYAFFGTDESGRVQPGVTGTAVPSAFMPPLYPFLVALAHQVSAEAQVVIRLLQGVNLVLAGLLVHAFSRLVRDLARSHLAGLLAGLLVALHPTLVYGATQVSASNLYLPLEVALLALLLRTARRPLPARAALVGLGLGVLTLLRAEAVALVPLVAVWLWRYTQASGARARLVPAVIMTLVASVLPVAWMVTSSARLGAPVTSITTTAGFNLWIGNHEGASGSQKQVHLGGEGRARGERLEQAVAALPPTDDHELRRDEMYLTEALGYLRSHPGEALVRDVKKLGLMLVGDLYDPRSGPLTVGLNLAVLAGGVWGAWGTRLRRETWVLLTGYALTSVGVCFVFFTLERYTLPLKLVLLALLAARLAAVLAGPGRPSRPRATAVASTRPRGSRR